jgi:hypothetical protein
MSSKKDLTESDKKGQKKDHGLKPFTAAGKPFKPENVEKEEK